MREAVIEVNGLGKRYTLGAGGPRYHTLRESLAKLVRKPLGKSGDSSNNARNKSDFWALRDISFTVNRGETVGIIGRNGAGKSTLLKLLSRITQPSEGEAILHGRVGSLLEVGTGFHPELSGRENVFLNGAILGMSQSDIRRKFDQIVEFAEVEKFVDTPVKRYSSGMYMRLAFAVAAHLEPEILVVDEVLAVGDSEFQKKCLGKMDDVARQGRTVLFVSHNMAAIRTLCTRAILLQSGHLLRDGPAEEVAAHYFENARQSRAELAWTDPEKAPGNDRFVLQRVRATNTAGMVTSDFDDDEPVNIEIDYLNLRDEGIIGTTIMLFNQEGICVFSSPSTLEPRWHNRPRPRGLFRSTCRVPADLLAEGQFSVNVLIWGENFCDAHREDNVIEFRVQDTGRGRGGYFGHWAGVIRPRLAWDVDFIGAPEPAQTSTLLPQIK